MVVAQSVSVSIASEQEASVALYKKLYDDGEPKFIAVAPGRVNLIGEHVDHQGYSVLPAALNQTIQVAVGHATAGTSLLEIRHFDSAAFPTTTFKSFEDLKVAQFPPRWTNYLIASLLGIFEYKAFEGDVARVGTGVGRAEPPKGDILEAAKKLLPSEGLRVAVDGQVPLAAGVSSSSAVVVAVTLAFSHVLGIHMSREVLAASCANSERHVGTAGGGMDQAAICLSQPGMARLIHFVPLRTEAIPLPPNGVLVVCNTGREAPKAVHAATCYNKRVFELKLACYMMLRGEFPEEDIPKENIPSLTLRQVQERLGVSLKDAADVAKKHLPLGRISRHEAEKIFGKEKREYLVNSRVGPAVWERNMFFEPLARALHVYAEAERVAKFAATCRDTSLKEENQLKVLGELMNASDESLTLHFDCGCPELDEVTTLAREAGAYGSRMTGAGWGGCTVSLVHKDNVGHFIDAIKSSYFSRKNRLIPVAIPDPLERALFTVVPGDGARIYSGVTGAHIPWN